MSSNIDLIYFGCDHQVEADILNNDKVIKLNNKTKNNKLEVSIARIGKLQSNILF